MNQQVYRRSGAINSGKGIQFDKWLVLSGLTLLVVGLLMLVSSSIVISEQMFGQPFHFLFRQIIYLILGISLAIAIIAIDTSFWQRMSPLVLVAAVLALILVLVPGIGHEVNGSQRWLRVGPMNFQVSEMAKLFVFMYLSSYLVRHGDAVRQTISGFLRPMFLLVIVSGFLLLEPDFGAVVVIFATSLGMLFLAGVRLSYFAAMLFAVGSCGAALIVFAPYRLKRLTAFLDPWANPFDSGYQLTQSLIAFGRGGLMGVGLGESIQKRLYLPEPHTDFVFAITAEEVGLVGVMAIISLFCVFVYRGLCIARQAMDLDRDYAGYLAYGLSLWVAMQTIINIGVNIGLLPTKGLTLPFMSYGGSSMLVNCMIFALLLRIDRENRYGGRGKEFRWGR